METSRNDSQIETTAIMAKTACGQSAGKFSHFETIATKAVYSFQDIESKARRGAEEVATLGGLVELLIFVAVTRAHEWIRRLVLAGARDGVGSVGRGSLSSGGPDLAQA
jgi:hypothetical protein